MLDTEPRTDMQALFVRGVLRESSGRGHDERGGRRDGKAVADMKFLSQDFFSG
jgi:hypothetical protein